jgi:hypothetical protein
VTRHPEDGGLVAAILMDFDEIVAIVALASAIDRDPTLQNELRRISGVAARSVLSLEVRGLSGAAIEILPDGGVAAGRTPAGLRFDYESLVDNHEPIGRAIADGRVRATQDVRDTLLPLLVSGRLPTRAEFVALRRWAPLIEKPAYRICAKLTTLLETWRATALSEPETTSPVESTVARYYGLLHTMGYLTLLASGPGAGPWLRDMAKSFTWVNWTPTFPLVRERTVWLAASAARSAAAFGAEVVPLYLRALAEARHPMKVFDALFGLVAIACAEDSALERIRDSIARIEQTMRSLRMPGQDYADLAFQTAAESLRVWDRGLEPPKRILARLGWNSTGRTGLATRAALTLDPTDLGTTGEMIGLAALPAILRSTSPHHFPVHAGGAQPRMPPLREMRSILRRAWSPATGPVHTLH